MTGFAILFLCAYGIGGLYPISKGLGFASTSLKFILGYLTLPIVVYVSHSIIGLGLIISCQIGAAMGALGLCKIIIKRYKDKHIETNLTHPIVVLPLLILIIAQFMGGVSYMPYSGDEFSGWLTIPKQAFALGEFDRTQMRTAVTDYVPSWYILLLFTPTLLSDTFSPSFAALTPLVLHIGLISLTFDLIFKATKEISQISNKSSLLIAWTSILLILTVETSGALVARNLLIEPPQIYSYGLLFILLSTTTLPSTSKIPLFTWAGILLALSYLIKSAAIVFVPAFLIAVLFFITKTSISIRQLITNKNLKLFAKYSTCLTLPCLITLFLWNISFSGRITPTGSPELLFSSHYLDNLLSLNILKISYEFNLAVLRYILTYKVSLTILAVISFFLAIRRSNWRPIIITIILFFIFYYLALFWSHLTIFSAGPTSVPRYMRVPIQVFHMTGLCFIIMLLIESFSRSKIQKFLLFLLPRHTNFYLVTICMLLGSWQIFKISAAINELSLRTNQVLPPHTLEIKKEANNLQQLVNFYGKKQQNIVLINHPQNPGIHKFAWYNLITTKFGKGLPNAKLTQIGKFPKDTADPHAREEWKTRFNSLINSAHVIWPVATTDPSTKIFEEFDLPSICKINPKDYFFIRISEDSFDFICVNKLEEL